MVLQCIGATVTTLGLWQSPPEKGKHSEDLAIRGIMGMHQRPHGRHWLQREPAPGLPLLPALLHEAVICLCVLSIDLFSGLL